MDENYTANGHASGWESISIKALFNRPLYTNVLACRILHPVAYTITP